MCKAYDVACYMVNSEPLDNLKVQKLLYYCQAVHLVLNKSSTKPLFTDEIQAWQYGPVVPNVYHKFKKYGLDSIPAQKTKNNLTEDELKTISMVLDYYGKMSGTRLINKTHQESPWKNAYIPNKKNIVITNEAIFDYFKDKYEFGKR